MSEKDEIERLTLLCAEQEKRADGWREKYIECCKRMDALQVDHDALADVIDFRMADKLSDAVAEAAWQAMKKETNGYEPASMSLIDNNGFTISLEDPRPDGYTWTITGKRERK